MSDYSPNLLQPAVKVPKEIYDWEKKRALGEVWGAEAIDNVSDPKNQDIYQVRDPYGLIWGLVPEKEKGVGFFSWAGVSETFDIPEGVEEVMATDIGLYVLTGGGEVYFSEFYDRLKTPGREAAAGKYFQEHLPEVLKGRETFNKHVIFESQVMAGGGMDFKGIYYFGGALYLWGKKGLCLNIGEKPNSVCDIHINKENGEVEILPRLTVDDVVRKLSPYRDRDPLIDVIYRGLALPEGPKKTEELERMKQIVQDHAQVLDGDYFRLRYADRENDFLVAGGEKELERVNRELGTEIPLTNTLSNYSVMNRTDLAESVILRVVGEGFPTSASDLPVLAVQALGLENRSWMIPIPEGEVVRESELVRGSKVPGEEVFQPRIRANGDTWVFYFAGRQKD